MKSPLVLAIAAASLSFSALSFAQDHDRRGGRDEQPQIQQQHQRQFDQREQPRFEPRDARRDDRHFGQHNHPRFEDRHPHRYGYRDERWGGRHDYYNARGPEFRRGHYIPREFRSRQYYVNDYRAYHLSPPPRGQQWVQVGSDYVLIAITTGLIAHMVLNH